VLARQVTTVDHLSGGRAVLGVGLGVPPDVEYGAFGESASPRDHAALLDEGLEIIDALWTGDRVDHHGPAHHLNGVRFAPVPVQRPRVPVWAACSLPSRAGVRRALKWDGIAPVYATEEEFRPASPSEVASIVADVSAVRSVEGFDVIVWAVAPEQDERLAYADAGATWLIEGPAPGDDWLDDAAEIAAAGPPHD
jgi:alkanesulfonate monooxygenase SsuD/methylene tetrahydromethanopterin reductase-like flavin-dependent oxidoreductase (luciferase family)